MIQPDCLLRSVQRSPEAEDAFTADLEHGLALEVEVAEDLAAGPGIVEVLVPKAQGVSQPPNTLLLAGCGFTGYNLIRSGHWSGLHRSQSAPRSQRGLRTRPPRRGAARGKRVQDPYHREANDSFAVRMRCKCC